MSGAMVDMRVAKLTVDPWTNLPVVVLRDEASSSEMRIGVGVVEASAIASELEKVSLRRPATHDLMKTLIERCGATVQRIEVRELRRDTFYAAIILLRCDQEEVAIDARPSDAIALALRTGAPIRVAEKVLERTRRLQRRGGRDADRERTDPLSALTLTEEQAMRLAADPGEGPRALYPRGASGGAGRAIGEDDACMPLLETLSDDDFGKWKM